MGSRHRHPKKEWEALLSEAEARGHTVTRGQRYFRIWCRCGDDMESIPLTPSNRRTLRNKTANLRRWSCWDDEEA